MSTQFDRTELVIGTDNMNVLHTKKVAVFGIGGVGGYCVEGLARAGIGNFVLIDSDVVDVTNINRQIIATHSTIGQSKVDVMKQRIIDINSDANVDIFNKFYLSDSANEMLSDSYDYIVDAIDTVSAKIDLVIRATEMNIPIISSMGMGNKLFPTKIKVADIYDTSVCKLARVIRQELRKRGIDKLKVVYSDEDSVKVSSDVIGSVSFVPSVAGLVMAGEVIRDLIGM